MDFKKDIEFLETEIMRLNSQREQEEAMAQVLPARFEQNMAAFQKFLPDIHKQFDNYQPAKPFKFFCNENGIPNLLWLDNNVPFYGLDPFLECKQQIDSVLKGGGGNRNH